MTEAEAVRYLLNNPHGPFPPAVWLVIGELFERAEETEADVIERRIAEFGEQREEVAHARKLHRH